jgi:hypothetical protein
MGNNTATKNTPVSLVKKNWTLKLLIFHDLLI